MQINLSGSESLVIVCNGSEYTISADGRISDGNNTFQLADIFDMSKTPTPVTKVDYKAIVLGDFIREKITADYLKEKNIHNLHDFIQYNDKIMSESSKFVDIFCDYLVTDRTSVIKLSNLQYGKSLNNIHVLHVICFIYKITGGDFPLNLSINRCSDKFVIVSSSIDELLSSTGLNSEDINKKYYRYLK